MTDVKTAIQRRPVLAYYLLTFAISWSLLLLVGGSDLVSGADWDSSPTFVPAIMAMLTGPAIAGLLLTGWLSGRAGLRELLGGLGKWRASARWYAVAFLTPFVAIVAVVLPLSLASSVFEPPILTADDKAAALLAPLGVGFTTLLEELGWTGFAIPRLRRRYSVFTTALVVGSLWGVWHLLQVIWVGSSTSEEMPPAVYLPLYLGFAVASLTAYRVLMVWVYDHTASLLVATLMHASYAAATLQLDFLVPKLTGSDLLLHRWLFTAALWVLVAGVAIMSGGRLSAKPAVHPSIGRGLAGRGRVSA